MEGNGKTVWVIGALVVGLVAGYFVGDARGGAATEQRYTALLDIAFPPPASVTYALTGTITERAGASFTLAIPDPDDYLPRPDGSPQRTELRRVNVSANTTFTDLDHSVLIRGGEPVPTDLAFSELQVGDIVTVRSSENIRDAQTTEATAVERVRY